VGDGAMPNTAAFRRAVAELGARDAGGGGARLDVPPREVAHGQLQPHQPLHPLPAPRRGLIDSQVTSSFISSFFLCLDSN
jgi:hypothetical protein